MIETQVGFLVRAVETLTNTECNSTQNLLKSYYLMRCRELTKGFGLPEKYFSPKVRCPRCFVDWKKGAEIRVQQIKLSKKQRRRIKHKINNKQYIAKQKELLSSNKIEQICTFCKNSTTTVSLKPSKFEVNKLVPVSKSKQYKETSNKGNQLTELNDKSHKKVIKNVTNKKPTDKKTPEVSVYSKSRDAFSLANKDNTLQGVEKQKTIVKNNKRKKDKFAGLCQQAVLASAKLKEAKKKENKLNLFLKPSTYNNKQ